MKSNFEQVKEFQTAFNQPVADKPQMLERSKGWRENLELYEHDWLSLRMAAKRVEAVTQDMRDNRFGGRVMFRASLISEELAEFLRADTLIDQVDALTDILYLVYGTAVEMGVDLDPCFAIVHGCNMAKLGSDGKPIVDVQGKVRKPDGWEGPESILAAEIERQSR